MRDALEQLLRGGDLTRSRAAALLLELVDPVVDPAVVGAVFAAWSVKGVTPEELLGLATAMRRLAVDPGLPRELCTRAVDIVGTGGDASGSLNLSTGAALLTAACGVPVVKHGNRSVSGRCGSADVLEALGLKLPSDGAEARAAFRRCGFVFLFAPRFHPAMRNLATIRRSLGIRTVFNLLGPLINPAAPGYGVIGAYSPAAAALMAAALSELPVRRAFVVHGAPGWDEATPVGPFLLHDVRRGSVVVEERDPAEVGIPRCSPADLAGGVAARNAQRLRCALEGESGPHRDALMLGAALALEVTGAAGDAREALARARAAVESGAARRTLAGLTASHEGATR